MAGKQREQEGGRNKGGKEEREREGERRGEEREHPQLWVGQPQLYAQDVLLEDDLVHPRDRELGTTSWLLSAKN